MAYTNEALGKALEDLTRAYDNFIKNAKDQVVQSLGTEVVDDIKQEANAYVSAQIDEKIETKISTAMAGEEAVFLEKVDKKISKSSDKLKKDVSARFINYFKNGYIQWPGMPSPLEDASLHFEGYSWHEVNYDGNFFRAKGRNAKAFSSKKLTAEKIKNGTYAFQDDEQGDAIRNIKGSLYADKGGYGSFSEENNTQLFKPNKNTENFYSYVGEGISSVYPNRKGVIFDASQADGVKVAEENRSRNLTFVIWALVKDEED